MSLRRNSRVSLTLHSGSSKVARTRFERECRHVSWHVVRRNHRMTRHGGSACCLIDIWGSLLTLTSDTYQMALRAYGALSSANRWIFCEFRNDWWVSNWNTKDHHACQMWSDGRGTQNNPR